MSKHLLVRHEVADFEKWKHHFYAHKNVRLQNGIMDLNILRNSSNKNDVALLFEVKDVDKAKTFTASKELQDLMKEAGVISKPELYFLDPKQTDR